MIFLKNEVKPIRLNILFNPCQIPLTFFDHYHYYTLRGWVWVAINLIRCVVGLHWVASYIRCVVGSQIRVAINLIRCVVGLQILISMDGFLFLLPLYWTLPSSSFLFMAGEARYASFSYLFNSHTYLLFYSCPVIPYTWFMLLNVFCLMSFFHFVPLFISILLLIIFS